MIISTTRQFVSKLPDDMIAIPRAQHEALNARIRELEAENERLKTAAVPLCIGPPLIGILAKEGAWQSSTGQCIVAADELHRNDPYECIRELEAERDAIRAKTIEECAKICDYQAVNEDTWYKRKCAKELGDLIRAVFPG